MHDEHDGAGTSEDELDVEVPGLMDQMRIDRAISMLTGLSRSEASALLASGAVSVDGKVVTKASVPLVAQQRLEAVLPVPPDLSVVPEPEVEVDVLFVDEDLIVVNKSALTQTLRVEFKGIDLLPGNEYRVGEQGDGIEATKEPVPVQRDGVRRALAPRSIYHLRFPQKS